MQPDRCQAHARRELRRARSSARIEARSRPGVHAQATKGGVTLASSRHASDGMGIVEGKDKETVACAGFAKRLRVLGSRIPTTPVRTYVATMPARFPTTGRRARE
jgi:hypothetical protein